MKKEITDAKVEAYMKSGKGASSFEGSVIAVLSLLVMIIRNVAVAIDYDFDDVLKELRDLNKAVQIKDVEVDDGSN